MASQKPIQIQIPTPCREDWDAMETVEKGRFCSSCQKTVVDFSRFSNSELLHYFNENQGQKVCGRLREDQKRVHYPTRVSRPGRWWPLVLGALVGSVFQGYATEKSDSFHLSQYEIDAHKSAENELLSKDTVFQIKGQLFDYEDNEPISFASISLLGHSFRTSSDFEGKFTLNVPDSLRKDSTQLKISMIGYNSIFLRLSTLESGPFLRLNLLKNLPIVTMGAICTVENKPRYPFWHRVTSIFRRKKHPIEAQ